MNKRKTNPHGVSLSPLFDSFWGAISGGTTSVWLKAAADSASLFSVPVLHADGLPASSGIPTQLPSGLDAHLDANVQKTDTKQKQQSATSKKKPTARKKSSLPNPGKYDDLLHDLDEIGNGTEAHTFVDGLRIGWQKVVYTNPGGSQFVLQHAIHYTHVRDFQQQQQAMSDYEFSAIFQDTFAEKQNSRPEVKTVARGAISKAGSVHGIWIRQWLPVLSSKLQFQLAPDQSMGQDACRIELDYGSKATPYAASFSIGKDLNASLSYIRSVHEQLSIGAELRGSVEQRKTDLGFGARYKITPQDSIFAQYSEMAGMCQFAYLRQVSKQTSIVAEVKHALGRPVAVASLGWKLQFGLTNASLRGSINSEGRICTVVEQHLGILPISVALGGEINHMTGDSRVGVHVNVEMRTSDDFQDMMSSQAQQQGAGF